MLRLKELFENKLFLCFFGFCGFLRRGLECDRHEEGAFTQRGKKLVREEWKIKKIGRLRK